MIPKTRQDKNVYKHTKKMIFLLFILILRILIPLANWHITGYAPAYYFVPFASRKGGDKGYDSFAYSNLLCASLGSFNHYAPNLSNFSL